jgi:hypothetical protein
MAAYDARALSSDPGPLECVTLSLPCPGGTQQTTVYRRCLSPQVEMSTF